MAKRNQQQPTRTRTRKVDIMVPTSFAQIALMTGIPAQTIGKRYHEAKAQAPRSPVHINQLTTYQRRSKYNPG